VSIDAADQTTERLAGAGVKASARANRLRLSCHLYNNEEDVDRTLEVLADATGAGGAPSAPAGKARA
jgi:selenocysteine lyase/cysteine desulfurase